MIYLHPSVLYMQSRKREINRFKRSILQKDYISNINQFILDKITNDNKGSLHYLTEVSTTNWSRLKDNSINLTASSVNGKKYVLQ